MRIYDLTALLSAETPVYRGDANVSITPHRTIAQGHSCNLSLLQLGSHTGTHIDVPKHFVDNGATCDTIPLSQFIGTAKVFDLRAVLQGRLLIEPCDLEELDIEAGDIVLFNTGNSPLMREPDFHADYVSLSPEAAAYLTDKKIKTVGVDYLSVEAYGSQGHRTHLQLLEQGVTIVEGLVFDNQPPGFVPQGTYHFSALPLKIKNGDGSPVRAVLIEDRSIELVIFDMDGLLLDTETLSIAGWRKAGEQMGHTYSDALFAQLFGCNRTRCRQKLEAHFGPDYDFETAYGLRVQYINEQIDQHGVSVKPGAHALLDLLEARGIKRCVATSTDYARADYLLTLTGLRTRFDAVIGGDGVTHSKPHPEIFLKAAATFGVDPAHCLVLEDSASGVEAACAGGMRTLLVPDQLQPDRRIRGRVCAVCADLQEAAAVIRYL